MSRSSGAGSPVFFRCGRCKTMRNRDGRNYEATGNVRPSPTRRGHARGIRSADRAYEYRCLDCKHVGWSMHKDVERKYKRQYGDSR